jgi:mannose-6-phosphate isomerase-like protein (cupin superfamily)
MKRLIPVGLLVVGYLAGYATSQRTMVLAQGQGGQAQQAPQPPPPQADGKTVVFSKEQIEKMFPPADQKGDVPPLSVSTHLAWDPMYRFTEMRRAYFDPPRKSETTGEMIRYPDAEMHENKTQIYIVWRGTATMVLGGKPEKERPGPYYDGQHGGASKIIGGTSHKVKPGDVVVIPPRTWHLAQVDPGQTFSYHMCHIETPRLIP